MRALRHRALGLALIVIAAARLPQELSLLGNMLLDGYGDLPLSLTGPAALQVLASVLLGVTGVAIAWRRRPGMWFAAYLAATIALAIVMVVLARGDDDFSPAAAIGGVVELVGLPVLIAAASLRYRDELEDERVTSDVVALLLITIVGHFVMTPLYVAKSLSLLWVSGPDLGQVAGFLLWPVISLGVAVVGAIAAARISRDPASRMLGIYVRIAIIVAVARFGLSTVTAIIGEQQYAKVLILMDAVSLTGLSVPIAMWLYGRTPLPAGAPSRVPLWVAVSFVPALAVRVFLSGEMAALIGPSPTALVIAIAATEAALVLAAFDTGVRRLPCARWWMLGAAVGAGVILTAAAYYVLKDPRGASMSGLGPIGELFVASAVAAWLYRR